ncbi:MAG: 3-oxoacyl-ACP synthase, partial [Coriobacteriales bacterium]|nr:3-oxoacyl-ACP synthase [Coriobacteriales bacterium]
SLACCLQRDLGLRREILAFDLNAACSGFIYALICAAKLMREGDCALVVGSEVLSRFTDFSNRSTCVLFGDAAAAAVVAPSAEPLHWTSEAHGDDETLFIREHIGMNGPAVFRFAVEALVNNIQNCTAQAQLTPAQIDLYICHQANQRIIASAAKKLGLPLKRFFLNLARFGNTSAASIPLALDEAACTRVLRPGMRLVMAGFGGGLTAGAICLTWGDSD